MLFNSYVFLLFFLPVTIIGYFTLNRFGKYRWAMLLLLGMSLWFYGFFNYSYLLIMVISILFNYAAYKLMNRFANYYGLKKAIAVIALLANVGALFYFKYFDFCVENINVVLQTDFTLRNIVLPLGISFFTFQQMSFVIDAYKGEIPDYNFVDYASFVSYFPQLVAGPIVTHDELVPQFADLSKKRFNWDNFTKGLYTFTIGMSKKVLIADVLGNAVNWGYANIQELDSLSALLVTLAYTVQIYFDFSGYSDMAIGMGKMMNIDLPINFNSPYKALSINDFWSRWHMTLTRFFTKYIYIPLGGNRKGVWRTYVNIMVVYLVSGIWHGANWTFIFWGICHGLFCVFCRKFKNGLNKLPRMVNWVLTFAFVNMMWIFFRADSMGDAFAIIKTIANFQTNGIHNELISSVITAEWEFAGFFFSFVSSNGALVLLGYIFVPLIAALCMRPAFEKMQVLKPRISTMLLITVLLGLCVLSFSGVSTFLYFNF